MMKSRGEADTVHSISLTVANLLSWLGTNLEHSMIPVAGRVGKIMEKKKAVERMLPHSATTSSVS